VSKRISKHRLLVVGLAVGGLLLGALGYVALIAPQRSEAGKLDGQLRTARSELVIAKRAPKVKGAPLGAADLFRLTKAMPSSDDMPGILIQLSRLANSSKVDLVGLTPSPAEALNEGYSGITIQLSLTGKYANVTDFLHRLRSLVTLRRGRLDVTGRLLIPNNITLTPSATGSTVAATVSLAAFVYGGAAPSTAAAAPPSDSSATTTASTTTTPGSAG
jgi:Tfp pilus assembly protein PilO